MKMNRPIIKKLPTELANLISAGEVVERPASVVKELVENSIDANATVIRIELFDAGIKKVSIIDDGCGMTEDDINLAVLPHATSKIATADDLFSIATLGFRGEALPSISSVSKVTISSSIDGYNGIQKKYVAGTIKETKNISFPKGTAIEVEDLFFNTPARFKHLSNASTELSHILSFVNRCSLAYPNIAFILSNNSKVLYATTGDGDYAMIIRSIYGHEVAKNMISFEDSNGMYKIHGFTSTNSVFRSNKNSITMMINNRIIKNNNLTFAITDAYKSTLPIGKYPITILMIDADTRLVDVNVHPTKQEVRFTDEYELRRLIAKAITNALSSIEMVYSQEIKSTTNVYEKSILEKNKKIEWDDFVVSSPLSAKDSMVKEEPFTNKDDEIKKSNKIENDDLDEDFNYEFDEPIVSKPNPILKEETYEQPTFELRSENHSFFKDMKYIGQYNKTYLLLEKDDNLYLLDQHAGMERFMYEMISSKLNESTPETYELMIPLKMELPAYEINLVLEKEDEFAKLGITFEQFGKNTLLIRNIPVWIPSDLQSEYLNDIFSNVINNKKANRSVILDELAMTMSCKKSIKANMNISLEEVNELLRKLDECKNPFTCPHGRPTIIKFTKYEIEKLFKRVI